VWRQSFDWIDYEAVHHDGFTREFHACSFVLDGTERYFLWYSIEEVGPDPDRVLLDETGQLREFHSLHAVESYAGAEALNLHPTWHARYDFDTLAGWLNEPTIEGIDCERFLSVWNLFDDMLLSTGQHKLLFDGVEAFDEDVYDKLFWGTNPPALTPEGSSYEPIWSAHEMRIIERALAEGFAHFRALRRTP
jgi:hypothetical protein